MARRRRDSTAKLLMVGLGLMLASCGGSETAAPVQGPSSTPVSIPATLSPPTPIPTATLEPTPTLPPKSMVEVELPPFDPYVWKISHGLAPESVPRTLDNTNEHTPGDSASFYVIDSISDSTYRTVNARLLYANDLLEMWFESPDGVDRERLQSVADRFAQVVAPALWEAFGREWSPGIDGSPRVAVLHLDELEEAAAYFSSNDEYPAAIEQRSNQREIVYLGLDSVDLQTDRYLHVLAHEFQHLIQWNNDPNEESWLDEGLAQLAELLAGSSGETADQWFLSETDIPLSHWPANLSESRPHYGASYLFSLYLWERYGDDFIQQLARHPDNGLAAARALLADQGVDADRVFADWVVANFLDDPQFEDGRYGYRGEQLRPACPREPIWELPANLSGSMPQYSARYLTFRGEGRIAVQFRGEVDLGPIPAGSRGEQTIWWSNRGDSVHTTLTRAFDLSGVDRATLEFTTWFDIEPFRDSGYVSLSTDGGETWEFLEATQMWTSDQAPYYSGVSGGSARPKWITDAADLSAYVGQQVLIRFEYVARSPYAGHGWAIDEIRIPELGYLHDAELDDGGWEADGFVRTGFNLPQRWELHLIHAGDVQRLPVRRDGLASARFTLEPGQEQAVLVIAAMAPRTKVEARFQVSVEGSGSLEAAYQQPPGVSYADDFGDVCSGWWIDSTEAYQFGYQSGEFFFAIDEPGHYAVSSPGLSFTDMTVQVTARQIQRAAGSSWGVVCRYQDAGSYYAFEIRDDGAYTIYARVSGEIVPLQDWTSTNMGLGGESVDRTLAASCIGDRLTFDLDGELLAEVFDSRYAVGDIGLTASTDQQAGARVVFDDLSVTRPDYALNPDILFFDNFEDRSSGWVERSNSDFRTGYLDGAYRIEIDSPDLLVWALAEQDLSDVIIEVDTTLERGVQNNSWGVFCRFQDADNTYGFEIAGEGWYVIYEIRDGQFANLLDWSYSKAINSGNGAINHLQVSCIGDRLSLSVNGKLLAEIEDTTHQQGDIGLVSSTYLASGSRVSFDNLILRQP